MKVIALLYQEHLRVIFEGIMTSNYDNYPKALASATSREEIKEM